MVTYLKSCAYHDACCHCQDATKTDFATRPAGAPHFGDIMGGTDGKGADLLHHFKPLERVILTANGNLQRVIRLAYCSYVPLMLP